MIIYVSFGAYIATLFVLKIPIYLFFFLSKQVSNEMSLITFMIMI